MNTLFRTVTRSYYSPLRRAFHSGRRSDAVSKFSMPAMSPTMTEGGIANWKLKEGDSFTAGDVILEIETDKATMDVEAQDDGIVGKIIVGDGAKNVPVGQTIALLAEEGDDISNLEVPKEGESAPKPKEESKPETTSSSPTSAPSSSPTSHPSSTPEKTDKQVHHITHSRPLFPSVMRLLQEYGVEDPSVIKGTGVRGMLRKGDVLAHLGKASGPWGTSKDPKVVAEAEKATGPGTSAPAKEAKPVDPDSIRRLIVEGLALATKPKTPKPVSAPEVTFYDIISDYEPSAPRAAAPTPTPKPSAPSYPELEGLI